MVSFDGEESGSQGLVLAAGSFYTDILLIPTFILLPIPLFIFIFRNGSCSELKW